MWGESIGEGRNEGVGVCDTQKLRRGLENFREKKFPLHNSSLSSFAFLVIYHQEIPVRQTDSINSILQDMTLRNEAAHVNVIDLKQAES